MTVVRLPSPLYSYTNGKAEVKAAGGTLSEILSDLDRRFPGLRFRVVDEQDRIRPTILFHLNGRVVRDLGETVAANDEVQIVAALSGG
jgi:molybdopterin converting factor small subunit